MRRRDQRSKHRHGVALIIALFTVFAVLTMGVTYIGISLTNSRASAGYEKEAMIVSFANSGIEFALNFMGNPNNWEDKSQGGGKNGVFCLNEGTPNTNLGQGTPFTSPVTVKKLSENTDNEFYRQEYHDNNGGWIENRARIISTQPNLATLGIMANQNYFGDWQILIYPEAETGSGEVYRFNTNFRVIVRARIYSGQDPATSNVIASREVMARVSNEFPGSVYQNIRAYDAAGGFCYPNQAECTHDAVFIAEDFKWDGGIRVDGSAGNRTHYETGTASTNEDDAYWGVPQKTTTFSHNATGDNGWVSTESDTSGSMKIDTLGDLGTSDSDRWPKFNGKVITNKGTGASEADVSTGLNYTDSSNRTQVRGIQVDAGDSEMTSNTNNIFQYVKDPYEIGVPSMDITDSLWKTTDGEQKLGYHNTATGSTENGYFYNITSTSGAGKWYQSINGDELVPDASTAFTTPAVPTFRITMSSMPGGKTNYNIQKYVKSQTTGEFEKSGNPSNFSSDEANWQNVIYVRGGNVQVVGGKDDDSVGTPTDGDGGDTEGNVTVPTTVVADSNVERDAAIQQAIDNPDGHYGSTSTGYFDSRLTTANLWDPVAGKYVYPCYKQEGESAGTMVECTRNAHKAGDMKPIWFGRDYDKLQTDKAEYPGSYWVFPAEANVNAKMEGNLSIIGDLTYNKNMDSPSLGLAAKNHVYLNDMNHPSMTNMTQSQLESYEKNTETAAHKELRTLELDATVASKYHSMQMDFFNFNCNRMGKPAITPPNPPSSVDSSITKYPVVDPATGKLTYINMWANMPPAARTKAWWDYYYGADQPDGDSGNYNSLYKFGIFKFTGAIISRFADVEADAGNPKATDNPPCMGYPFQNISYDSNLKNRSAPFLSTSSFDKNRAKSLLYWSVLTYVDKGALSETKGNL
ncbi:MAG: hypothetical protein AB9903_12760 [Vulcanimicrobiota bacterium]